MINPYSFGFPIALYVYLKRNIEQVVKYVFIYQKSVERCIIFACYSEKGVISILVYVLPKFLLFMLRKNVNK